MRLYHGSNISIDNINLAMCRPYKDFRQGFYLTDIEEQAQKHADCGQPVLELHTWTRTGRS